MALGLDSAPEAFPAWVKGYNSAVKVLAYWDVFYTAPPQGSFPGDEMYTFLTNGSCGNCETAFLHSSTPFSPSNRIMRNAYILNTYEMNPGDPAYQNLITQQAQRLVTTGHFRYHNYQGSYFSGNNVPFDGIMMDDADGFYGSFLSEFGNPVEYQTGGLNQWADAMFSLWRAVQTAIPSKMTIANAGDFPILPIGIGNATGYADEFAPCAWGCTFSWDEKSTIIQIIGITKNNPNTVALMRGTDALYTASSGLSLDRARMLDLALYYILAHNANTYLHLFDFSFSSRPTANGMESTFNSTLYNLDLGKPLGDTTWWDGVYGHFFMRKFQGGIVISKYQSYGDGNSDATAETIQLGGTYTDAWSGISRSSITLRNGEAFIGRTSGSGLSIVEAATFFSPMLILIALAFAIAVRYSRRPVNSSLGNDDQ